jgi:hypothetical protein
VKSWAELSVEDNDGLSSSDQTPVDPYSKESEELSSPSGLIRQYCQSGPRNLEGRIRPPRMPLELRENPRSRGGRISARDQVAQVCELFNKSSYGVKLDIMLRLTLELIMMEKNFIGRRGTDKQELDFKSGLITFNQHLLEYTTWRAGSMAERDRRKRDELSVSSSKEEAPAWSSQNSRRGGRRRERGGRDRDHNRGITGENPDRQKSD